MRRLVAASAAACALIAGMGVTSARAQVDHPADAMGDGIADRMSGGAYMPPGIMLGRAGELMLGYQYMLDKMHGSLVGTSRISNDKFLRGFATTPTDMTMQMHMLMAAYAPSDNLTLLMTLPSVRKSMNHVSAIGAPFIERTDGIGDLELRGFYTLFATTDTRHRILLTGGVGLPTGSINKCMGEGMRLEYPMQVGSGTVSLLPGLVYLGASTPWSWGAEFGSNVRLGENSNGYRLGDRRRLGVWGARQLTNWLTVSMRADGERSGNIHGADPLLDPMDEPTKDPMLQGGTRLDLLFGTSLRPSAGILKGQQFSSKPGRRSTSPWMAPSSKEPGSRALLGSDHSNSCQSFLTSLASAKVSFKAADFQGCSTLGSASVKQQGLTI